MNWQELLGEGSRLLSGRVSGEAASEARELLFSVCGWTLSDYAARRTETAREPWLSSFRQMALRRAAGEPLQYVTGEAPFFGYIFRSDRRALIPRFDTEILVETALGYAKPGMHILDICTGSGCIPIALALECRRRFGEAVFGDGTPAACGEKNPPEGFGRVSSYIYDAEGETFRELREKKALVIEGADISEEALSLARENAALHGLEMRFFQSDLLETAGRGYAIITANPPYITEEEMGSLDAEVRDHEPALALFGGRDGLDFYRRIAREAPSHLAPGGRLIVEIGCAQAREVSALFEEAGLREIRVHQDLAGRDRVVEGCLRE